MANASEHEKANLRDVRLNVWEIGFLRNLSERGGETLFDFRKVSTNVESAILQMGVKGLIEIKSTEYVNERRLRLSDRGRACLEALEKLTIKT